MSKSSSYILFSKYYRLLKESDLFAGMADSEYGTGKHIMTLEYLGVLESKKLIKY